MNDNGPARPSLSLADRVKTLKLDNAAMDGRRAGGSWLLWVLCLAALGASGYVVYSQFQLSEQLTRSFDKKLSDLEDTLTAKENGTSTFTGSATSATGAPLPTGKTALNAPGYIMPVQTVQVSPKVGGQVLELFIEEGMRIEKGQIIAKLDRTEYQFEYDRAKAVADQVKARYDEMEAGNRPEEKRRAEAALKEAEELRDQLRDEAHRFRSSGRAATTEDLVRIDSRLRQAELRAEQLRQENKMMQDGHRIEKREAAKAEWLTACAQRDKAKYYLDNTDVVAPIAGTILIKRAEVGNTVRPESFGQGLSANVCDMADLTQMEVDVDVSERDLTSVWKGQLCEVRTEAFPDVAYPGYVARMMPIAKKGTASIAVRVRMQVPPNDERLRPEMRARVKFFGKDAEKKTE